MSLVLPMLAHIGWVFMLYVWLTLARKRAVARGEVVFGDFARHDEPHEVARITYNLANQFELPLIFYALAILLTATKNGVAVLVGHVAWLAWQGAF